MMNYYAIVVATVASMLIGTFWYMPKLFGNHWMKFVGLTESDIKAHKKTLGASYFTALIASLISAYVMSFILELFPKSIWYGILVGFVMWLGFTATTTINTVLWEKRTIHLWVLQNVHYLLSYIVMGIILTVW